MIAGLVSPAAWAGPPFATDDPGTTDAGAIEFRGFSTLDAAGSDEHYAIGIDASFGTADDVEVAMTAPFTFARTPGRDPAPMLGDMTLGLKVRRRLNRVSLALAPAVAIDLRGGNADVVLPLWAGTEIGGWELYGGGGYTLASGAGERDHVFGGLVATRRVAADSMVGLEVFRLGPVSTGDSSLTRLSLGAQVALTEDLALLTSAGPQWPDRGGLSGHAYLALQVVFD